MTFVTQSNSQDTDFTDEVVFHCNPFLVAVLQSHSSIIDFFANETKVCLQRGLILKTSPETKMKVPGQLFVLATALINPDDKWKDGVFQAFWNSREYIWGHDCWEVSLLMVLAFQRADLLDSIMMSRTMSGLFRALSLHARQAFLLRFLGEYFPMLRRNSMDETCELVFRHHLCAGQDY